MSNLPVSNQLTALKMTDALSAMSAYGGLAKSCRFAVRIAAPKFLTTSIPDGRNTASSAKADFMRDFTYLCEAAEMPGRGFMSLDVRYYGPAQKLPFQSSYEDITLTFLCRTESFERQFFDDWMEAINPTNSFDFNYRSEYETSIQIIQMAEYEGSTQVGPNVGTSSGTGAPKETYRITLFNSYPILINPQPMTWADDQMQRLAVTFTYHKWKRVGYDNAPKAAGNLVAGSQNIR